MCEALEPMKMEGRAEKAAAVEFKVSNCSIWIIHGWILGKLNISSTSQVLPSPNVILLQMH